MSNYDYMSFYRRNLPHIQPSHTPLFVTFRLAGSLPIAALERLKEQATFEALQRQAIADPAEIERQAYDDQNADEWLRIVAFVLNNPVKAELVETWETGPWNFVRDP
jgi:hypothetical protein